MRKDSKYTIAKALLVIMVINLYVLYRFNRNIFSLNLSFVQSKGALVLFSIAFLFLLVGQLLFWLYERSINRTARRVVTGSLLLLIMMATTWIMIDEGYAWEKIFLVEMTLPIGLFLKSYFRN